MRPSISPPDPCEALPGSALNTGSGRSCAWNEKWCDGRSVPGSTHQRCYRQVLILQAGRTCLRSWSNRKGGENTIPSLIKRSGFQKQKKNFLFLPSLRDDNGCIPVE